MRVSSLTSFTQLSSVSGGHKRSVRTCAWKPHTRGESVLATGSFDASAGIWRKTETGDELEVDVGRFEGGRRQRRGGDDDDDYEGASDADSDDKGDDEYRFAVILDGHESEIKSVAWSAGGQFLATCSRDKSVWVWEEMEDDNFETVAVLQEHEGDVKCVVWHPEEDLLASASYDDTIRLYKEDVDDWTGISVLNGHSATVWCLDFEPVKGTQIVKASVSENEADKRALIEEREKAGPRLISSSDDLTIRIWRRKPKDKPLPPTGQGRMPSILRTNSIEEEWVEEAQLPARHERAVYSVSWSKVTGRVVSTGSDGKIIVYEERWKDRTPSSQEGASKAVLAEGIVVDPSPQAETPPAIHPTEWVVVGEVEAAHGVFEVNHVCWTNRADRSKRRDDEEVIVSTGDDGEVRVWKLD